MQKNIETLPDWDFDLDEVSAGVYKVTGKHILGCGTELVGTDPEELMSRAEIDARKISDDLARKNE